MAHDAIEQFRAALRSRNIEPPAQIIPDGRLQRCDAVGKPNKKGCAYVLHIDGMPAGGYQNFADGLGWENWRADIGRQFTHEETQAYQAKIKQQLRERRAHEDAKNKWAAGLALKIWDEAKPLLGTHAYLTRKGISPHGVRCIDFDQVLSIANTPEDSDFRQSLRDWCLVIPLYDDNRLLKTLAFIDESGAKRYLPGGPKTGKYFVIGDINKNEIICECEGYATGCSIFECTGYTTVVAFDSGNLQHVAKVMRSNFPDAKIIICADDDCIKDPTKNPGLTYARKAAEEVGGFVALPEWSEERPPGCTDFNDLHQTLGEDVVRECIDGAKPSSEFRTPVLPKTEQTQRGPTSQGTRQGERPVINVIAGDRSRQYEEMFQALLASGGVFCYGNLLARVLTDTSETAAKLVIEPYTAKALAVDIEEIADIYRYTDKKERVPTDCKILDAEKFMTHRRARDLPRLVGTITAPYFSFKTGHIYATPGYDKDTGLYLDTQGVNFEIEKIPENPTSEDVSIALNKLDDVIGQFPFVVSGEYEQSWSKSVAIAAIMTAIQRPLLPSAPIFAFSASRAGSGKTKLAEIVSIIGYGAKPEILSHSHDETELTKKIETVLLDHAPVNCLDNINGTLSSEVLCQALSGERLKFRVLGAHSSANVPTNTLWLATGNTIEFASDLRRRSLISYIDARMERPDERHFDFDPVQRAFERRAEYVRAVLTILQAYHRSGIKVETTEFGGFEVWSDTIRHALIAFGEPDPKLCREYVDQGDPRELAMKALVNWMCRQDFVESVDSARFISLSFGDQSLAAILENLAAGKDGRVSNVGLGRALTHHDQKVFTVQHGGTEQKVQFKKSITNGTANYSIVKLPES